MRGIQIDSIGGNCPVQAEGTIDGKEFYFRARGQRWSMGIGGDPVMEPEWCYAEPYGDEPFSAGWMEESEARAFIMKAVERYRIEQGAATADDGQPDEQQEWRDFDPDC